MSLLLQDVGQVGWMMLGAGQAAGTCCGMEQCVEQSWRPDCVKGVYAHHISADTIVC